MRPANPPPSTLSRSDYPRKPLRGQPCPRSVSALSSAHTQSPAFSVSVFSVRFSVRFSVQSLDVVRALLLLPVSVLVPNRLRHLPDLQDVVLGHSRDHPIVVGVPGEVRNLGRVARVDEEEFGRTIGRILCGLLLPNARQVPHHCAAIGGCGGEDALVERGPLHAEHLLLVSREGVQPRTQIAQIPQRHLSVGPACEQKVL
mmetsp:Transcript_12735/g.32286  ORF Transcript_12735/g.32286 Transcript_12735/m.32286 type:complete len:201 (+) Transcript_12735:121-723(+)